MPLPTLLLALPEHLRPLDEHDEQVREAWQRWFTQAAAHRPHIATDPARVVALLAQRLVSPLSAAALDEIDGPELWLAAGCGQGLAAATACFDTEYLAGLDRALGHMKLDGHRIAEIRQRVREKLLLPEAATTKLEQYAGRGQLATLVRVIATRTALDLVRADGRAAEIIDDAQEAEALLDAHVSPERAAIEVEHAQAFKTAFAGAVEALDASDRGLLRLHVVDRLGIDAIAALHNVHRSTAARWLQQIRERLGTEIRRRLRARLGASRSDLESMIRAVDSRLDLSFSRLLPPGA